MKKENDQFKVNIDSLVGLTVSLYGVDGNVFKIRNKNGDVLFLEAIENESDGYRSTLDYYAIHSGEGLIISDRPIVDVLITCHGDPERDDIDDVIYFKDAHGHIWLRIGTRNVDDWYPCFVFSWTPPEIHMGEYVTPAQQKVLKFSKNSY